MVCRADGIEVASEGNFMEHILNAWGNLAEPRRCGATAPGSSVRLDPQKMATRVAAGFVRSASILKVKPVEFQIQRTKTTTRSGRVLPKPKMSSLTLVGSFFVANAGILTGASFSRAFANFLEEHDLFVVEDDDDDD